MIINKCKFRWKPTKYVKKMKKNIIVVSYAKIIVQFVSVVSFYSLFIYIYGKMIFLMAHRFLFSLVTPLVMEMQHFPLAKTSAKTPAFSIKTVSSFVFMIFTCFTAKFRHLWLQNIANKQLESLQQFTERQTDRARKGCSNPYCPYEPNCPYEHRERYRPRLNHNVHLISLFTSKTGIRQKNHKRQYGSIHVVLSHNFHQPSKDIRVSPTLPSQWFFVNFHQTPVSYFCSKRLLKNLNQGQYRLTHSVLLEKVDQLLLKTHMARCCIFSIFLANFDQEALWPILSFQGSYICLFKDLIQIST